MAPQAIRDIIGRQNFVTLTPDTTVRAAAKVMAKHRIGAVPVTEAGKLKGIFTERDLMNRIIANEVDTDSTCLGEVMTADPETIEITEDVSRALQLMLDGEFRHLPVTRDGTLVGIVSIRDIPPEFWAARENANGAVDV